MIFSGYISGAARLNAGPVATGKGGTRPIAAGTVAGYRLQEAAPGGGSTPTEGLTTGRDILLMATQNPTGDGSTITLNVQSSDEPFLRRLISAASDGLGEELARFAGQLREPTSRLHQEAAAYRALLDGLGGARVSPDEAMRMREALATLAYAVDRETNTAASSPSTKRCTACSTRSKRRLPDGRGELRGCDAVRRQPLPLPEASGPESRRCWLSVFPAPD